ncbi:MerR family transcriptional regulator [Aestuariibacter halophilus]|uniref:MerR family transcriptional regulator n=1 Tax=Fluctibacter halophilus TaxID=226011 RepID=A0ABS8G368_9ALTE|nr:MerR family transcriptional regulator [Aestuariibacter halophilus]MCC2614898.1 MerR family transcriptional regulator [Aestuariibacter halophilus]
MKTVTALAKAHGISRTTVLYYERRGLLHPKLRSANGYRWYGKEQENTLALILSYRDFGLPISKVCELINNKDNEQHNAALREQFQALEREIQSLRQQQHTIVALLQHPDLLQHSGMTKDRWVNIMRTAGLSDEDMQNWHRSFEKMEPDEHQHFLASLGLSDSEISTIRKL